MGLRLRPYLQDVGRAFNRAPAECGLTLALACAGSWAFQTDAVDSELLWLAVAVFIAAGVCWCGTLAHAMGAIGRRTRMIADAAGGAAAVAYLLLTPGLTREPEAWRALMLMGAVSCAVFLTPGIAAADRRILHMRRIDARILLRIVGMLLYGLALLAGLALAINAVDHLFELHLRGRIYGHVFIWIMIVLVPWVVAGGINDYVAPIENVDDTARVVHRLTTYLVPPLVAVYFLILCAYIVRIAVTRELPQNLVSPMVIAAGLLSCIALLLFEPDADTPVMLRWLRYTPVLLLLLAPIAWWALQVRLDAYGWTVFRVIRAILLIALIVLALAATIRLLRRQSLELRFIPAVLGVALLIGATGPWGAIAISRRSQQHRLRSAINALKLDAERAPTDTTTRTVPNGDYVRVASSAEWLENHFGSDAVAQVVPGYRAETPLPQYYHLASSSPVAPIAASHIYAQMRIGVPVATSNGVAYRIDAFERTSRRTDSWTSNDSLFVIARGDTIVTHLAPAFNAATTTGRHGNADVLAPLPAVRIRDARPLGSMLVLDAEGEHRGSTLVVRHVTGIMTLEGRSE